MEKIEKDLETRKIFRIFVHMIPVTLKNGRVVFVTLEESLDDEFMRDLDLRDDGYEIDDPFDSCLDKIKDPNQWEIPDLPSES